MDEYGRDDARPLSANLVPMPAAEYNRAYAGREAKRQTIRPSLKLVRSTDAELGEAEAEAAEAGTAGGAADTVAGVVPLFGSRALIYKQDPTVSEIGIR